MLNGVSFRRASSIKVVIWFILLLLAELLIWHQITQRSNFLSCWLPLELINRDLFNLLIALVGQ